MRKFKKLLAMLVTAAMLLSMVPAAFAAPPGGPGGAPGGAPGMPGGSSAPADLTGMLALKQYVFVASQGETANGAVSTPCYGVYAKGAEGQAAFAPQSFSGEITVYQDEDMTKPCAGVEAAVSGGVLTMSGSGMDRSGNTVYYLSTGEGAYPTTIYVVNDEYSGSAATLTLADGDTIQVTTYAPNMARGDYKAVIDANVIDGNTSVYLGGNRTAVSLDELTDTANYSANKEAAAWYLTSSGITNAGATMTTFGDTLYNFEYTMGIYRLFQIECKQMTTAADFVDTTDYVGAMMSNDQFSDAISVTMNTGIWNGIYTKMSDELLPGSSAENPAYILTNIDAETRTMGFGNPVTVEFAYVGIYNAFASKWSTLNGTGEKMAADLAAAAAAYDGEAVTAPADYTNAAKISAVATVLLGETEAPAADKVLTKIEAVAVLYAARNCVTSKTSPDAAFAARVGSSYADLSLLFQTEGSETQIFSDAAAAQSALNGKTVISGNNTAVLLNNIGGTVSLTNSTFGITDTNVGSWSTSDETTSPVAIRDPRVGKDGLELAIGDPGDGLIYNAMGRNAYYHDGIGSGIAVWGASSILDMTSDNGTLVLSGSNGSMSGTAFAGFGGTIKIHNAVAYSSSQHLTNILFNGTVHYEDAYALGSGRLFSSDVWGAYQVFEDTIGNGGNVTDEPTTIIAKNSVYGNSIGGNGYASQYFENSVLNVGTAGFANKTSLITDVASLTLVNSVLNNTSGTLFSIDGGANAIITLVDSEINLPGNTLANIKSWDTINHPAFVTENPAVAPLFHSDAVVRLYGNNTITTTDGTLTASVAEGATLTIYGKVVDASGNAITIPGATIKDGEGTLTVLWEGDGLLDGNADRNANLTWSAAAQLINRLMKDSGLDCYDSAIIGASDEAAQALANLKEAGLVENAAAAAGTMTGAQFDALLAAALNTASLEGIGEYAANTGSTITLGQAHDTILAVVLLARSGAELTGDTNKFLCIEAGSTWTPESKSGTLHVAGIIGYGTIAGIRGYGEKSYNLETKTYNGLTIYYNPYAGSANIVMPSDPRSYEMCYVEGGARLYPDYPVSTLGAQVAEGAYATGDVTGAAIEIGADDGKTAAVYVNNGTASITGSTITASTGFSADLMNISTLGQGDAVIAATENAVLNISDSTINSLTGRGATAIAGATLNIDGAAITNKDGSGSHGVCVLYGSVIDIKNSTIDANTSALSSDFGGGLIIADNVKAYADSRGGGALADGMTFVYVTNSELKTAHDAAATTAGCGHLEISNSTLEGNDKAVLYSYVFGMLASNKSIFKVSDSTMTGNAHGIYIQGNTIDMYLENSTLEFDNDGDGAPYTVGQGPDATTEMGAAYLIYAENPTVPAPFYTRANIYLDEMNVEGDIFFNAAADGPCVVGYTETYLNIYVGLGSTWTGKVVSTENNGGVHLFRWNVLKGDYEEVEYELDTELTVTALGFEDVNDEWFASYVYDVAKAGLMGSTSTEAALFAPLVNMTRAEVATIIYRMAGQPEVSSEASFGDVEGGQWYTDAVYWAAAQGIVNGRDESTFGTFDNVTRQELVAMLYRYVKGTEENVDASASLDAFADKGDVADWAVESMQWAVGAGVINGGDSGLNPTGGATRAEVATILANLSK